MNADEALKELMEGNKRFMEGKQKPKDFKKSRIELAKGQHPIATVICCSDSRVVPEYIFDVGLGEIFTVISAGNVVDNIGLGSIEYAVAHLHTPLVIVMGHEKCGAVGAAYDSHKESFITSIVEKITKAVSVTKKGSERSKEIELTCSQNVKNTIEDIKKSPIIKQHLAENKIKIVGLKYSLESGKAETVS